MSRPDLTKEELDNLVYWTGEEVWIDFGLWCSRIMRRLLLLLRSIVIREKVA